MVVRPARLGARPIFLPFPLPILNGKFCEADLSVWSKKPDLFLYPVFNRSQLLFGHLARKLHVGDNYMVSIQLDVIFHEDLFQIREKIPVF